jgi:hypothetical protein
MRRVRLRVSSAPGAATPSAFERRVELDPPTPAGTTAIRVDARSLIAVANGTRRYQTSQVEHRSSRVVSSKEAT